MCKGKQNSLHIILFIFVVDPSTLAIGPPSNPKFQVEAQDTHHSVHLVL